MKLAVVAGGWHWPYHFYASIARMFDGADLYVIAHRSPELPIVRSEKAHLFLDDRGRQRNSDLLKVDPIGWVLEGLDRVLYKATPTVEELRAMGWKYSEHENTVGDWGFLNQWLEGKYYPRYEVILNLHDDTWVRPDAPEFRLPDWRWLLCGHGRYPEAPAGYVRGSLEFWRTELLVALGGHIDLGEVKLDRTGQIDTPSRFDDLSPWNDTAVPLRNFMRKRGWVDRIAYLSDYYRVSPWFIEGERGFLHSTVGAPWSYRQGLAQFPLTEFGKPRV